MDTGIINGSSGAEVVSSPQDAVHDGQVLPAALLVADNGTVIPHSGAMLSREHPSYGQLAATNSLLSGAWKRQAALRGELTPTSSWTLAYNIFTGEGDGITQIENLNIHVITSPSTSSGFFQLRVLRWNGDLKSSLTDSDVNALGDDYRINIRDRVIPVRNAATLYETRIPRLRLRSDEKLAAFLKAGPGVGSKVALAFTYSYRELDKGDI